MDESYNFSQSNENYESLSPNLEEWVAVKENVFGEKFDEVDGKNVSFSVQWAKERREFDVTFKDWKKLKDSEVVASFTSKNLKNVHKLTALMYPCLNDCFPTIPSGSFFSAPKMSEKVCVSLERYFQSVLSMCGRQLLMAVFFETPESDDFLCELYQESMSELKLKSLEVSCEKSRANLQDILNIREKCDNMLQLSSVFPLEKNSVIDLLYSLSLYYEFHIQPFIDLRKVSHERLKAAGGNSGECTDYESSHKKKIREYQEQIMSADDSILNLRKEYQDKRIDVFSGQLKRLFSDQKKYGKSAFEVFGLDLLHALELNVSMEKLLYLKLCRQSLQHEALKIQHKMLIIPELQLKKEAKRVENEAVENQIKLFDIKLDILNEEESVIQKKLTIVYKQISDDNAVGVFHDAVENIEDADSDSENAAGKNKNVIKFKQQLSRVYSCRANLRNKKKLYISKHKMKQQVADDKLNQYRSHHKVQMKLSEKKKHEQFSKEAIELERQKTLERLRNYRMKFPTKQSKDNSIPKKPVQPPLLPPPPPLAEVEESYDQDLQNLPLPKPPKFVLNKKQPKKKPKHQLQVNETEKLPPEKIDTPHSVVAAYTGPAEHSHAEKNTTVSSTAPITNSSDILVPPPVAPPPPPVAPPAPPPPPVAPPPPPFPTETPTISTVSPSHLKDIQLKRVEKDKTDVKVVDSGIQLSDILSARKNLRKKNERSDDMIRSVVDADLKLGESATSVGHSNLLLATLDRIRNCNIDDSSDEDDQHFSDFE